MIHDVQGHEITAALTNKTDHLDDGLVTPIYLSDAEREYLYAGVETAVSGIPLAIKHKLIGSRQVRKRRMRRWWQILIGRYLSH